MRNPLKVLIFTTIGLSLCAGLIPQLYSWLALSWTGIKHLFLWQLISYIFLEERPISLGFFISLAFNMYILWVFGSTVLERFHVRSFFLLYFGATFFGALSSLIFPNTFLAGSANGVYAILVAWLLLNQGAQLLLFFSLPFRAEWLIFGLISANLLLDLASADWAEAISLFTACFYSYIFTLVVWHQPGPFFFLKKFEKRVFQFLERRKDHEKYSRSKIYDIKSGEPVLDDEQFMDAMLDRISRHGEESLTLEEKKRMREISSRKK